MQLTLISHEVENGLIYQRASDGYVNATAMCLASGKDFYSYARNLGTQEFLAELSSQTGISASELVVSVKGGDSSLQGTWVHPDVAINLGQWCSPKFAVAVSRWVREWISGQFKSPGLPYHIRRYLVNRPLIPPTHFSMLNEMVFMLIAPLEDQGYSLPDNMLPDISTGRMFCKWLREEKGIDTDLLPTYRHEFEDGRVVYPKLYPNEVLADFKRYFVETWLPMKAQQYFESRDGNAVKFLPGLIDPALKLKP